MKIETNASQAEALGVNRRDFLKSGSFATLMTMLGGVQLFGETNAPAPGSDLVAGPHVSVAVVGLGAWGREILNVLSRIEQADITAICDTYGASVRRSANAAPKATQTEDFKTILENKDIKAVIIATPTHLHKDLVLAALKAGKHVYCEAPLAHTIEDARAIALAARDAKAQVFQAGLQMRSDPQRHFLLPFIRSGALGKSVMARAQWHKKQSWRSASPNADREKALNWRLQKETSLGLIGEIGTHQIDQACWFLNAQPVSIIGFGSVSLWKDGRDVFDTIQTIVEFPGNVRMTYDCTLANSFDADYEMYYGSHAAVMLRENKAWMFKEVDSPLLGWEVYAKRNTFYKETGIALVAGASKQENLDRPITAPVPLESTPLYNALLTFVRNSAQINAAAEDFVSNFGADDPAALRDHLVETKNQQRRPGAGFVEGFQAAVISVKANEAILSGQRVVFQKEWLELT